MLAPALMKLKSIQSHIPAQNAICDDFVHYLEHKRDPRTQLVSNIQDATYRLALESISMMCLDSRMGCLSINSTTSDGNTLIAATKSLFDSYNELYYGLPLWKFYPTKSYKKLDKAESTIYETASKYVEKALARLKSRKERTSEGSNGIEESCDSINENGESVLETLLNSQGLSEEDVKITIIDFISGGIFTVSNSLAFLLYHLARNPISQETLHQELRNVLSDDETVTGEKLAQLPYLKACVKEAFRLSSTVPGIMRILPDDVLLSGHHIPAGVN